MLAFSLNFYYYYRVMKYNEYPLTNKSSLIICLTAIQIQAVKCLLSGLIMIQGWISQRIRTSLISSKDQLLVLT